MRFTLKQLCLTVTACSVAMAIIVGYGLAGAALLFLVVEGFLLVRAVQGRSGAYALAGLGLILLVFLALPLCVVGVGGGHFTLIVNIRSKSSRSVRTVSYVTCPRKEDARAYTAAGGPLDCMFQAAQDFDGATLYRVCTLLLPRLARL